MRDEPALVAAHRGQQVRVEEEKNRALADANAELRGHTCLGPELCYHYTLSRLLRKAVSRRPGNALLRILMCWRTLGNYPLRQPETSCDRSRPCASPGVALLHSSSSARRYRWRQIRL